MKVQTSPIQDLGGGVYILHTPNAIVTTGLDNDAAKPSVTTPNNNESNPWSAWGSNNLFPQEVMADLELNTVALRALEKRKNVHYGRGIVAYREVADEKKPDAMPRRVPVTDPEIVEWLRVNRVNIQQLEVIGSLEIFANAWVEMITNRERKKINKIFVKDPCYCRYGVMDDTTGRIEKIFYSANWDKTGGEPAEIPTYDPSKVKESGYTDAKFVYPLYYRSFNRSYYHMAIWNSVRANGWMAIANKVPGLKKAIMENQMTIKYHIQIPDDYFTNRYPHPTFDDAYREARRKEKIQEMNDFLSNVENSGKALVTFSYWDKTLRQEFPGWKINVIDNKLKDDAYLPDSQAANSEILFAIGVDPSLIGSGMPGGKLGAGSGSDKREAFWMLNAEMGPYRTVSLDWLYFVRDFNGWGADVQFDYMVVDTSQTQNEHPTKIKQNVDPNTTE